MRSTSQPSGPKAPASRAAAIERTSSQAQRQKHGPRQAATAPARTSTAGPTTAEASGNQAVQRMLGLDAGRATAYLRPPEDAREHDALRVEAGGAPASVLGRHTDYPSSLPRAVRGQGAAIEPSLRRSFEARFGARFDSVRMHTGTEASLAARALNAHALTIGEDILFGETGFSPAGSPGRNLLAHELTHVLQQRRSGRAIDRKNGGDSGGAPGTSTPPISAPNNFEVPVEIDVPTLPGEKAQKQTFMLQVKVDKREDIKFYAVPIGKLKLPKPATPPPPAPVGPPAPNQPIPSHPDIAAGSTYEAIDGTKLKAAASTHDHLITAEYTKFAVGAASTSALKLADGTVIVIDAGVNNRGLGTTMKALADLTIGKLAAFIGDGVIRDLLVSHAHADHLSLGPDILRRFPVDFIRINSVQKDSAQYKARRKEMVDAQEERLKAAEAGFKEAMRMERAAWEKGEGQKYAPDARELEWERHMKREFEARMEQIPGARAARERILIQSRKHTLHVRDIDLASGEKRGTLPKPDAQASPTFGAEDPYVDIRETMRPRPGKKGASAEGVDPNASIYVVTVKGGMRLMVMPDIRANDMAAIMKRFETVMADLKRPVTLQVWDATHHMQKGWYGGGVPATQMRKIVDFLFKFKAQQAADVVIVSAQADLTKPNAKTLVDPANLWLLRSLGFEAYLATSGRDVRVFDITTSQGTKLTGVVGAKAPGEGPSELTVKRAKMALEQLQAERQAQKVARKGEKDKAKLDAIDQRASEIKALEAEIQTKLNETLQEINENFKTKPKTTQELTDPPKKEFPKQKALDTLLETHNFDRPVTSDAQLTEMALVVLNQDPGAAPPEPGTPAARARQLAATRSKIYEIDARIKAGEATPQIHAELMQELINYRTVVNNELNPPDPAQKPIEGVSRKLLADDLKSIDGKIEALKQGKGVTTFTRRLGSGELIEQHAFVMKPLKPPSAALAATHQVAEAVGRGMGVVMVVTTVTGEGELMRRWQEGKATDAEAAIGSVRNVTSGVVGLLMMRGISVHPGVFVVMAALEVGEAAVRHYDTEEQHDTAVAHAAASAAINLGCMAVGMAIMRIPHPATVIAGLLITFAGPLVMRLLKVDEWIEKRNAFNPPEVVEVLQKLRKLLQSYRVIIGSIQIAKRAQNESDPTLKKRLEAKEQAEDVVRQETVKAIMLEHTIYTEFEEAYKDAKTNYAGLKDLDNYRAQFYLLRQQADIPAATAILKEVLPGQIRDADAVFKGIDAQMSIDDLSDADINAMPQWTKLDEELVDLQKIVYGDQGSDWHAEVRDKDKRVQAIFDNARYRLDPKGQGQERTKPMLSAGTAARRRYEQMLRPREAGFSYVRYRYMELTAKTAGVSLLKPGAAPFKGMPFKLDLESVVAMLEGTIKEYEQTVNTMEAPPGELAAALYTTSEAVGRYKLFMLGHGDYRKELQRLETTERMIDGYQKQVERMLPPAAEQSDADKESAKRIKAAAEQMKSARTARAAKRGILYWSELEGLQRQVWEKEVELATPLFDEKSRQVPPLTEEEELALTENRSKFNPDEDIIPPLGRRLSVVRSPMARDKEGNLSNIFRLSGQVQLFVGGTQVLPRHVAVSPADNALVGILAAGRPNYTTRDTGAHENVEVVQVAPLNDKAIAIFGGVIMYFVAKKTLSPVPGAELDKLKQQEELKAGKQ
jgi:hypothetical protein